MTDAATPTPTITKVSIPKPAILANPWTDYFPADDEGVSFSYDLAPEQVAHVVKKVTNQARAAAKLVDRTAKVHISEAVTVDGKGKETGNTTVTIIGWTVAKISKPRRPSADAAPEPATDAPAPA
jgi:hypothetical protein